MENENEVCSLKYAKELKKLGVEQDSLFYWCHDTVEDKFKIYSAKESEILNDNCDCRIIASAFTVTELWNKLPYRMHKEDFDYELVMFKSSNNQSIILYIDPINGEYDMKPIKDTPANAVAQLYIYLIKNQLIENEN